MKSVIAIRFVHFEDLGVLKRCWRKNGFRIEYVDVTGGEMAVWIRSVRTFWFPWVDRLGPMRMIFIGAPAGPRLIERRLAADHPTLGFVWARKLSPARSGSASTRAGARRSDGRRCGLWTTAAALRCVILDPSQPRCCIGTAIPSTCLIERRCWRPANSMRIRRSLLEGNVLGLQFHPEVTAAGLERWYIGHACEIGATPGLKVNVLRAESARWDAFAKAVRRQISHEWPKQTALDATAAGSAEPGLRPCARKAAASRRRVRNPMTLPPTKLFFAAPSDCLSLEATARNLGIQQAIGWLAISINHWLDAVASDSCFSEQVWPWPALTDCSRITGA